MDLAEPLPGCLAAVNNPKSKLLIIHDYNESGWLVGMHTVYRRNNILKKKKKKGRKIKRKKDISIGVYARREAIFCLTDGRSHHLDHHHLDVHLFNNAFYMTINTPGRTMVWSNRFCWLFFYFLPPCSPSVVFASIALPGGRFIVF